MDSQTQAPVQTVPAPAAGLLTRPVVFQVLRFAAIGGLNTALDILIYNFLSKSFGISAGWTLGLINLVGFSAAVVQSYFWNRSWAFSAAELGGVLKRLVRVVLVGALGAAGLVAVVVASSAYAPAYVYLISLVSFLLLQLALWRSFSFTPAEGKTTNQFVLFLVVSIIGALINSVAVGLLSQTAFLQNADLNKNLAKAAATVISLVWNFVGYKLLVFRR